MMLFAFTILAVIVCSRSQVPSCCGEIDRERHGQCRSACEELWVTRHDHERLEKLVNLADRCPPSLDPFWTCINSTYSVVSDIQQWSGRLCCHLARRRECSSACNDATSVAQLSSHCRQSDEIMFFGCAERQKVGHRCCSAATTPQCRAVCKNLFMREIRATPAQREQVARHCSAQVRQCIHNNSKATPAHNPSESLPCCDRAGNARCKNTCRRVLVTSDKEEEIVDTLIQDCGAVNPTEPMWQCFFLKNSGSKKSTENSGGAIVNTGIDGAKLQCCAKATNGRCRNLCIKTYSRSYARSWNDFDQHCRHHAGEAAMMECLAEVEEPCQMGCDGLSYCTNFNHRPTELFRNCNAQADQGARNDVALWEMGIISMPNYLIDIPVKDIRTCMPETWKAIACSLQIKPCHKNSGTMICKQDCINILSRCLDSSRLTPGQTAEKLCGQLSAESSAPCISLSTYMAESPHKLSSAEVTNPCQPNPCNNSQVCMISRRHCKHPNTCKPYICRPGCPMGEVSTYLVPRGSFVQVPVASGHLNCQRVCRCGHHNVLEHCVNIEPCTRRDSCLQGRGQVIREHGSHFQSGCNQCVCHSGEKICTTRECLPAHPSTRQRNEFTGLPCGCREEYDPVCGKNGRTYPSACIALCVGLKNSEIEYGTCQAKDHCKDDPCALGETCVARKQVCLSTGYSECKQYECVRVTPLCNHNHHDPVCDTSGEEHKNMCSLLLKTRQLAHRGHCLATCSSVGGPVCGHDGEVYISECAAWGLGVSVDYAGTCKTVGKLSEDGVASQCEGVQCPAQRLSDCELLTPPGGCCPICGAELRILFSKKQADRVSKAGRLAPVTVRNITTILSQHISVPQCEVFGYVSIESDLVILVLPVTLQPTPLQVLACTREAEKLHQLISTRSPTLLSHLALTPLVASHLRTSHVRGISQAANQVPSLGVLLFVTLLTLWWTAGIGGS